MSRVNSSTVVPSAAELPRKAADPVKENAKERLEPSLPIDREVRRANGRRGAGPGSGDRPFPQLGAG